MAAARRALEGILAVYCSTDFVNASAVGAEV
jgi:hypothetical protein